MKKIITRLYTGADGESHFEDMEISITKNPNTKFNEAIPIAAKEMVFREVEDSNKIGTKWHNAACRQYYILLEGMMEIEVGDGTRKKFGPGDVFLAEDLTGRGHIVHSFGHRVAILVRPA